MKKIVTDSYLPLLEDYFHIHGHFGDNVYRKKRNGLPWVYKYVFRPKYDPTVLSRRVGCITRAGATVSNPQYKDYSEVIQKIYYYTPFFVYKGTYSFTCNTFLKLPMKDTYGLLTGDMMMQIKLAPRTKISLTFNEEKSYCIKCFRHGVLFSEREVIVISDDEDLESIYAEWFAEHLDEIMLLPQPRFGAQRIYRHGIEPPDWFGWLVGKTDEGILYRHKRERFMYIRSPYVHKPTPQCDYFYGVQPRVTACWSVAAAGFKHIWEKYHIRWFDRNYMKNWKIVKTNNLWSKLVFQAGKVLGFDMETLTVEHFLPGVETIGDLIETANMGNYGLNIEELNTRIFYHE